MADTWVIQLGNRVGNRISATSVVENAALVWTTTAGRYGLKVLLAGDGLFSSTGGGQRFYESQVLRNPDIQFFAFSGGSPDGRAAGASVPRNLRFVPLFDANRQSVAGNSLASLLIAGKPLLAGKEYDIAYLMDLAASVSGMEFDLVDIPDYLPFAALLPSALKAFDVQVGRYALSMHGTISMGLSDNWDNNSLDLAAIEQFEDLLYRSVDLRYGISSRYIEEWRLRTGLGAVLVDPGVWVEPNSGKPSLVSPVQTALQVPELCFVGRQEKWKGPDIFVEFCSRLPRGLFSEFRLIGPNVNIDGHGSFEAITRLADTRGLKLEREEVSPRSMPEWYIERPRVVMLPSRRDTFNLVALESLMSGCPAIISIECGVVDYLDDRFPGIPFIRFDPADMMAAYDDIVDLADNFATHKAQLANYLAAHAELPAAFRELERAYAEQSLFEPSARATLEEVWTGIEACFQGWLAEASQGYSRSVVERFHAVLPDYSSKRLNEAFVQRQHESALSFAELCRAARDCGYSEFEGAFERNRRLLETMSFEFNRSNLFRFLAEFERERGNELLFATYMTRVFRLTGQASPEDLAEVQDILVRSNLTEEAHVLGLIIEGNQEAIYSYLRDRKSVDFSAPAVEYSSTSDRRREADTPRVSVIVSVYNAADLIAAFLRELLRQTPEVLSDTEYIFVDSCSVDSSVEVLDRLLEEAQTKGLQSIIVSTPERETIQRAWNRGIGLARGSYLTFLGVDETVRPDALGVLADYLDENPNVDWAQGNVVVTEVNDQGSFVRDVMPYLRGFDMQEMHYLDSCYIGFVGAMYRKSVHERFGLYDDTFKGAGDTEFKNRVLPSITVASIPEMLGTYLNYPSERTTATPHVELEDIRAWYAFRTPAGVRYLFESRDSDELTRLLIHCLGYRKTYLDFTCTDVDLAGAIIEYSDERQMEANTTVENWRSAVWFMEQVVRRADNLQSMRVARGLEGARMLSGTLEWTWNALARAREGMGGHGADHFEIVNDNRWQQHHWLWPSQPKHWTVGSRSFRHSIDGRSLSEIVQLALTGLGGRHSELNVEITGTGAGGAMSQWDTLDLVLVVESLKSMDEVLVEELTGESDLNVIIIETDVLADVSTLVVTPNVVRIPIDRIDQPELLLQAARLMAVPSVRDNALQVLELAVSAVCAGTPLVVAADVAVKFNQSLGLDGELGFQGIAAESSDAFLDEVLRQSVSGRLRERASGRSYEQARWLVTSSKLRVAHQVQGRIDDSPWTEYSVTADEFDDHYYFANNPDVAAAIDDGYFASAWEHFQIYGRAERRKFRTLPRTSESDGTGR